MLLSSVSLDFDAGQSEIHLNNLPAQIVNVSQKSSLEYLLLQGALANKLILLQGILNQILTWCELASSIKVNELCQSAPAEYMSGSHFRKSLLLEILASQQGRMKGIKC